MRPVVTRTGWWAAGSAVVLVVLGWLLRYRSLLLVGLALVLTLAVASVWLVARPRIAVQRVIDPARVQAGEAATARLTLDNRSRRRSPALVAQENFGGRDIAVALPSLGPGELATVSYGLPTARRGVMTVGPLSVGSTDPFNYFRARQVRGEDATLVVYPRWRAIGPFRSGRAPDVDGTTTRETLRGGVAFHSLRPYVAGDDMRLIHWPTTAKLGSLMVRHNVDATSPRGIVLLDTNPRGYRGDRFELAVSVAASLVMASATHHMTVHLRTTSGIATSVAAGSSTTTAMDVLAGLQPSDGHEVAEAVTLARSLRQASSLVVVTGELEPDELGRLAVVASGFERPTLVLVGGDATPADTGGRLFTIAVSSLDEFAGLWNLRLRG